MDRRAKITFNKKRRTKKQKPKVELVTTCDQCGRSLGRTCARTDGSAACASGCGIEVVRSVSSAPRFFCCRKCVRDYLDMP